MHLKERPKTKISRPLCVPVSSDLYLRIYKEYANIAISYFIQYRLLPIYFLL